MRLVAAILIAGVLAGCSSPSDGRTTGSAQATTPARTADPTAAAASSGRPAFLTAELTDVRDGTKFRLSDFPGKTVLVLGMAVW